MSGTGPFAGASVVIPFQINETDTLAGTSFEGIAPMDGYIRDFGVTVQKAVTTGGAVKVAVGTTDVVGATVTVADAATKGTRYSASATRTSDTRKISKGERFQVIPDAAFATAGAINGYVEINSHP